MYVYVCVHVCACLHVSVHMCACRYMCMCRHVYVSLRLVLGVFLNLSPLYLTFLRQSFSLDLGTHQFA